MAHIPMDDINELWQDMPSKSWSGFHQTLEEHKGKTDGISDNLINMMLPVAENMDQSGQAFPGSPEELYDVLNERVEKIK